MDYYLKIKNNGKVCIICQEMRFKMELKDLEKAKIINKKVYPVVPPKTEYSLTDLGKTLFPVIKVMDDWGANYRNS